MAKKRKQDQDAQDHIVGRGLSITAITDPHEHIYITAARAGFMEDNRPDIFRLIPYLQERLRRQGDAARKEQVDRNKDRMTALRAATTPKPLKIAA